MVYSPDIIGKRIKEERMKLNWSQEALGKELNQQSGAKQISKYESGNLPPLKVLLKLCDIFNCELGYLLGEEDYSSGTKIDTAIEKKLGLNKEAIDSIYHITKEDRSLNELGCHPEKIKSILNRLFTDSLFESLISSIKSIDDLFEKRAAKWNNLKCKYGEQTLSKAFEYYNSETDYLRDDKADKLDSTYYEILRDIDNYCSEKPDFELWTKIYRYDAKEEFERLLDNLYPRERMK